MSDAIGALAASASLAQAHFGESPISLTSRLVVLLNQEFANQKVGGATVGMGPDVNKPVADSTTSSVWSSLHAERSGMSDDATTRWSESDRHTDDDARSGATSSDVIVLGEERLAAIQRAARQASLELTDAGWNGVLQCVAIPGSGLVDAVADEACVCELLILCSPFDKTASDAAAVWGFGYTDGQLVLTLDGLRVEPPLVPDDALWQVSVAPGAMASGAGLPVDVEHQQQRVRGCAFVTDGPFEPDHWTFLSERGPVPC